MVEGQEPNDRNHRAKIHVGSISLITWGLDDGGTLSVLCIGHGIDGEPFVRGALCRHKSGKEYFAAHGKDYDLVMKACQDRWHRESGPPIRSRGVR